MNKNPCFFKYQVNKKNVTIIYKLSPKMRVKQEEK